MQIRSSLKNGIELRNHAFVNDGDGVPVARQVGDAVVLRPGLNEIDADFWRQWSKDNRDNPLRRLFMLVEEPPAPAPSPPPIASKKKRDRD